jgi:hypothetical protein
MLIKEIGTDGIIDDSWSRNTAVSKPAHTIIKSYNQAVGAVQKFIYTETATGVIGSCERIIYSKQNIIEAFTAGKYKTVAEIKLPFDIILENNEIITILKNCKIINKTTTLMADSYVTNEVINFSAKSILIPKIRTHKIKLNKFTK